jgi:hypothetical protein
VLGLLAEETAAAFPGSDDAAIAIELLQAGKAIHIQTCSRQPSDAEIDAADRNALETAQKAGSRAVLNIID